MVRELRKALLFSAHATSKRHRDMRMTGRDLLNKLQDCLAEDETLVNMDSPLTVPQLLHLKAWFEHTHYDAYYDPKTPCPHNGTRWTHPNDLAQRCGQCGRAIGAEQTFNVEAGQ